MAVYEPSEDSYLLSSALKHELQKLSIKKRLSLRFLEIGAGSGIQIETAFENGMKKENILGADINQDAVDICREKGFSCIKSNLFQKIPKTNKFDVIVFNPPYLPEERFDKQKDTTGGKKGNETINMFLKQAKRHLSRTGFILLLTSSFTPNFSDKNYKKKIIATKKLFFEELYVWKLTLK
jgi:HemK-related putative methylase